jgi:hypothetical protein
VLEAGNARRCERWPELISAANRLGNMRIMQRMQQALKKAVRQALRKTVRNAVRQALKKTARQVARHALRKPNLLSDTA